MANARVFRDASHASSTTVFDRVKAPESPSENSVYARSAQHGFAVLSPPQLEVEFERFVEKHFGQPNFADSWVERPNLLATWWSVLRFNHETLVRSKHTRLGSPHLWGLTYTLCLFKQMLGFTAVSSYEFRTVGLSKYNVFDDFSKQAPCLIMSDCTSVQL